MTDRSELSKNIVCLLFNHRSAKHENFLCNCVMKYSVHELVFGSFISRILSLVNKNNAEAAIIKFI